jgi:hypothetical protein
MHQAAAMTVIRVGEMGRQQGPARTVPLHAVYREDAGQLLSHGHLGLGTAPAFDVGGDNSKQHTVILYSSNVFAAPGFDEKPIGYPSP